MSCLGVGTVTPTGAAVCFVDGSQRRVTAGASGVVSRVVSVGLIKGDVKGLSYNTKRSTNHRPLFSPKILQYTFRGRA